MLFFLNTSNKRTKIIWFLSFVFFQYFFISCDKSSNQNSNTIHEDVDSSIVTQNGLLTVSGNSIVNKNNDPVSFAGNSFFWSNDNWGGERFYNPSTVKWLKTDWNSKIVRAAMGVEDPGGYLDNKQGNKSR